MAIGTFRLPIMAAGGGGIDYSTDIFTGSGTWNKPANLDYVLVLIVAGGAGGGSGRRGAANTNRGAGRGNNGGVLLLRINASDLDSTEGVVVGAGSAGAPGKLTDNTNGSNSSPGGTSSFAGYVVNGILGYGGGTSMVWSAGAGISTTIVNYFNRIYIQNYTRANSGFVSISDTDRGFGAPQNGLVYTISASSVGGQIDSSNTQKNSGDLAGYYNKAGVLTDEWSGVGEGEPGVVPQSSLTFGDWLNHIWGWFDAADANYLIGRPGGGGGPGDTAGTVAGGAGANGIGYGAAGGGGGASTNGANSGAGGDGTDGIVIIINVLT